MLLRRARLLSTSACTTGGERQLVVLPVYDTAGSLTDATVSEAAATLEELGVVVLPELYRDVAPMADRFRDTTDKVLADLRSTGTPIEVGSANGFHEVCLRSQGRYDVTGSFEDFRPEETVEIERIIRDSRVLGADSEPTFCGVVYSEPGSPFPTNKLSQLRQLKYQNLVGLF